MAAFEHVDPLRLDPEFMPPAQEEAPKTSLVPPLSMSPPPDLSVGGGSDSAMGALYGHLTEASPPKPPGLGERAKEWVEGLGSRKGLQGDKDGIGGTFGDWRLRLKPDLKK